MKRYRAHSTRACGSTAVTEATFTRHESLLPGACALCDRIWRISIPIPIRVRLLKVDHFPAMANPGLISFTHGEAGASALL